MSELYQKAKANLQKIWGYPDFRKGQDKAIASVLAGKETLVLFPTGGGKSLCYQVPSTVLEGITLVISPLVALMQDQVDQSKKLGISATFINATISKKEAEQRLINARNGMYRLLYVAPERLQTPLWQSELPNLDISLVAIDEAHCISEWGHDFRPPYRQIRQSFAQYPGKPRWLALTATATPEVQKDILSVLGFSNPEIIANGFNRENLRWWVLKEEQKEKRLLQIVQRAEGNGLVYAATRKGCEDLATLLTRHGTPTEAYHAGLDAQKREDIQRRWIDGSLPLVVATNAFGMGIDKPDCRYVVHYDIPYSMEAYYQEAGRAGRDGALSFPMALYSIADEEKSRKRLTQSYPELATLQKVYNALCDHWNLALGAKEEQFRPMAYDNMAKRAKMSTFDVEKSVLILQQLGVIELIEHVRPQTGLQFLGTPQGIESQIDAYQNPKKRAFADQLFRLYSSEGFHDIHYLETEYVLSKLDVSYNSLIKSLNLFQQEQLLSYIQLDGKPLARLQHERTRRIPTDITAFNRHRSHLFTKLERMHLFFKTKGCRTKFIRTYFGESQVPDECGNCDYCLRRKVKRDPNVHQRILEFVTRESCTLAELEEKTNVNPEELFDALSFLRREGLIRTEKVDHEIRYKKTSRRL